MYTILICDDDRDIVSALDIYLTSEGYRTILTYDGAQAVKAVQENDIHLRSEERRVGKECSTPWRSWPG